MSGYEQEGMVVQDKPILDAEESQNGENDVVGIPSSEDKVVPTILQTIEFSSEKLCYSQYRAKITFQCSVWLSNSTDDPVEGTLSVTSGPDSYMKPLTIVLPKFKKDKYLDFQIELIPTVLSRISETFEAEVVTTFSFSYGEKSYEDRIAKDIKVFPYNHWSGSERELSVFVTPNAEMVGELSYLVSEKMRARGEAPELDGYKQASPKRSELFCASVYDTLRDLKLNYALPPKNFTGEGQNIRMVDTIVSSHTATCLDSTLLFASILEAIHLNPFIVLVPDHAFVGCWLSDENLGEATSNDGSVLVNKLIAGKRRFCLIETTCICNSSDFMTACHVAEENAEQCKDQLTIVDVCSCRNLGIFPIQMDRYSEGGKVEAFDDANHISSLNLDDNDYSSDEVVSISNEKETDKITYWGKKLLDLSTRNVLISLNPNRKSLIAILDSDINKLEDKLTAGCEFSIKQSPLDSQIPDFSVTPLYNDEGLKKFIADGIEDNKLLANLNEQDLLKRLKTILYQANSDIVETGANTLFLALGILNWYEGKKSRFAPIILMPVELMRLSSRNYKIKKRDAECVLNYSIIEKLRQDYKVNINFSKDNLPTDDSGLDINKIFRTINTCIEKMPNWSVIPYSVLGIFSFSQFIIYNDLLSRRDALERNPLTSSLIKNHLEFSYTPIPTVSDEDIKQMVLPVSCDESQMGAVKAAKEGCSFVLQGPPGTGKSQTITAIIADSLASDKTVLFVAEKRAALEVVQRNLNKVGLKEFVLELHSTKATKEHIINQFEEALSDNTNPHRSQYSSLVGDIADRRARLNLMIEEINNERYEGLSLYDLICRQELAEEHSATTLLVDPVSVMSLSEMKRNDIVEELVLFAKKAARFAPLSEKPLSTLFHAVGDVPNLTSIQTEISDYFSLETRKGDALQHFAEDFPFLKTVLDSPIESVSANLKSLSPIVAEIQKFDVPVSFLQGKQQQILTMLHIYQDAKEKTQNAKAKLPYKMDDTVFDVSTINEFVQQARSLFTANLFQKGALQKQLLRSLQSYSSEKIDKARMNETINGLSAVMKAKQEEECTANTVPFELMQLFDAELKSGGDLESFGAKINTIMRFMDKIRGIIPSVSNDEVSLLVKKQNITDEMNRTVEVLDSYVAASTKSVILKNTGSLKEISSLIDGIDQQEYSDFCAFMHERDVVLADTHANEFVSAIDEGKESPKDISRDYELAFYRTIVTKIIDDSPALSQFDSEFASSREEEYRKRERTYDDEAQNELLLHLEKNKPDCNSNISQIASIKRMISNKGRGTSIREFFKKIPDYYARFFPCFLMSPLSVAQYLDPSLKPFDLVIFDEASQLTTSKAIGAISRAKQVIVVGDTKQMPPTSFFQKKDSEDDFSQNYNFEADLQSILNDVIAINMPEVFLHWHYRSKHESLIQFSNMKYYQNKLLTYPSVDAFVSHVSFVKVKGYYYPKSQEPNPAEVKAITDEVCRRLSDEQLSKKSMGIITFNERQQSAIRDRLDSLFDVYPKLAEQSHWFVDSDQYADQKLFVKNIENVQGDERDVILFSTCFGPTEDNPDRIDLRFGPIQQAGGERRLNVAFSRAKEEMVIFSIMNPSDLVKKDLKSKGLQDLASFLLYANEKNIQGQSSNTMPDPIKKRIGESLTAHGYHVEYDIGESNFKVDIGVYGEDEKTFKVGIVLDGPVANTAKTARDRELLRPMFLQMRGWRIVKVYTMDWYEKPDYAEEFLVQSVQKAFDSPQEQEESDKSETKEQLTNQEDAELVAIEKTIYFEEEYHTPEVKGIDVSQDIYNSIQTIENMLEQVINTYGPISDFQARKAVLIEFGVSRAGNRIQELFNDCYNFLVKQKGIKRTSQTVLYSTSPDPEENDFYWPEDKEPIGYRSFRRSTPDQRSINEIPFQEICNYLLFRLERSFVLDEDDIYPLVQECFSFKACTEKFKTTVDAAVAWGIKEHIFRKRDDGRLEDEKNGIGQDLEEDFSIAPSLNQSGTSDIQRDMSVSDEK